MSGRPSWKSAEISLFRSFSAFFALFRRVRGASGKSRKRRKKAFFLRYPQIYLNPHNKGISFPNFVERSILKLPHLQDLCCALCSTEQHFSRGRTGRKGEMSRKERHFQGIMREICNVSKNTCFRNISRK